ncbi:MAG TPA: prepilin peptidase [Methylocystis sp.]|nr:prepilin peptidase [Methylocystis sp.]
MLASIALVVFPLLMVFAALADLFTMTIPNRVSLLLIVFYFALALYLRQPWQAIALHASCGLAILALTFAMYNFRWIGGGDAKLAAATALWLGWGVLFEYGAVASLIGGVLTLAILELRRHEQLPEKLLSFKFVARLAEKNGGVPYGVALALAGLIVYPQTAVWLGFAGA